jgi:hypothetical protein
MIASGSGNAFRQLVLLPIDKITTILVDYTKLVWWKDGWGIINDPLARDRTIDVGRQTYVIVSTILDTTEWMLKQSLIRRW